MRVLSISEFQNWVSGQQPSIFIFSTENNTFLESGMMRLSMHFDRVLTGRGRICFRNHLDVLYFECVKEVRMYDDVESIGVVFEIICEGGRGGTVYRFIADKIM